MSGDGKELFETANEVRRYYVGDEVHLRGLIEFSNICKNIIKMSKNYVKLLKKTSICAKMITVESLSTIKK